MMTIQRTTKRVLLTRGTFCSLLRAVKMERAAKWKSDEKTEEVTDEITVFYAQRTCVCMYIYMYIYREQPILALKAVRSLV